MNQYLFCFSQFLHLGFAQQKVVNQEGISPIFLTTWFFIYLKEITNIAFESFGYFFKRTNRCILCGIFQTVEGRATDT